MPDEASGGYTHPPEFRIPIYPLTHTSMSIFRALGLGVLILVLGWLVPEILAELTATVVAFLKGARVSAEVATSIAASAGSASGSIPLSAIPLSLPAAPIP